MRIRNPKIHALSIAIISGVVVVYFLLHHGGDSVRALQGDDRYIQIDNATWGRNCDPYIAEAVKTWQPSKTTPKPHRATDGNALPALSSLCNGKTTCQFTATSATLGDEPLASCFKQLTLRYRCIATERLTIREFGQGETVTLDCTPKAT